MDLVHTVLQLSAPVIGALAGCLGLLWDFTKQVPAGPGPDAPKKKRLTFGGHVMLGLIVTSLGVSIFLHFMDQERGRQSALKELQQHGALLGGIQENIVQGNQANEKLFMLQNHTRRLLTSVDPRQFTLRYNLSLPWPTANGGNPVPFARYLESKSKELLAKDSPYIQSALKLDGGKRVYPVRITLTPNTPHYPTPANSKLIHALFWPMGADLGIYHPPIPQKDLEAGGRIAAHQKNQLLQMTLRDFQPAISFYMNQEGKIVNDLSAQGILRAGNTVFGGSRLSSLLDFEGAQLLIRFNTLGTSRVTDFKLADKLSAYFQKRSRQNLLHLDLGTGPEQLAIAQFESFKVQRATTPLALYAYRFNTDMSKRWPRLLKASSKSSATAPNH